MKSLNSLSLNNDIFTPEIMSWIEKEGFESRSNDSYCYKESGLEDWENKCFYKVAGYYGNDWPVRVYIFSQGIGVDVDYECGGNSSTMFWKFTDYDNDFERVYDHMVDYVQRQTK